MGFPKGRRRLVVAVAALLATRGRRGHRSTGCSPPPRSARAARADYPAAGAPARRRGRPAAGRPADRGRDGCGSTPPTARSTPTGRSTAGTGPPRTGRTGAGPPTLDGVRGERHDGGQPLVGRAAGGAGRADRPGRLAGRRAGAGRGTAPARRTGAATVWDPRGSPSPPPRRAGRWWWCPGRAGCAAWTWPTAGSCGGSTAARERAAPTVGHHRRRAV